MLEGLRLISFPRDDRAFELAVEAVVGALLPTAVSEEALAAAITDALRPTYPLIRIRSRDPIAEYSPEPATWSVYRDGRPGNETAAAEGRA